MIKWNLIFLLSIFRSLHTTMDTHLIVLWVLMAILNRCPAIVAQQIVGSGCSSWTVLATSICACVYLFACSFCLALLSCCSRRVAAGFGKLPQCSCHCPFCYNNWVNVYNQLHVSFLTQLSWNNLQNGALAEVILMFLAKSTYICWDIRGLNLILNLPSGKAEMYVLLMLTHLGGWLLYKLFACAEFVSFLHSVFIVVVLLGLLVTTRH